MNVMKVMNFDAIVFRSRLVSYSKVAGYVKDLSASIEVC